MEVSVRQLTLSSAPATPLVLAVSLTKKMYPKADDSPSSRNNVSIHCFFMLSPSPAPTAGYFNHTEEKPAMMRHDTIYIASEKKRAPFPFDIYAGAVTCSQ